MATLRDLVLEVQEAAVVEGIARFHAAADEVKCSCSSR